MGQIDICIVLWILLIYIYCVRIKLFSSNVQDIYNIFVVYYSDERKETETTSLNQSLLTAIFFRI